MKFRWMGWNDGIKSYDNKINKFGYIYVVSQKHNILIIIYDIKSNKMDQIVLDGAYQIALFLNFLKFVCHF